MAGLLLCIAGICLHLRTKICRNMDGLLLKSHRESSDDEPLLTVSTSSTFPAAVTPVVSSTTVATPVSLNSKVEILAALRGSPSLELVVQSLGLLTGTYNIQAPSAIASQLIKVLLEKTLLDFWSVLSRKERRLLSRCLASPAGLGGIAAHLKSLIPLAREREGTEAQATREQLRDVLALLQMILGRVGFVHQTWVLVSKESEIRRDLLWKEFATLVTGGRLVSLAAEADSILGRHANERKRRWVGDGKRYVDWLGKEIAEAGLCTNVMELSEWKALSTLLVGSFRLGYIGMSQELGFFGYMLTIASRYRCREPDLQTRTIGR
jgi:telomere length regulation protein